MKALSLQSAKLLVIGVVGLFLISSFLCCISFWISLSLNKEIQKGEVYRSSFAIAAIYNAAIMAGCEKQPDARSAFEAITSPTGMIPTSGTFKGKVFRFNNIQGYDVLDYIMMKPDSGELTINPSHP